MKMMTTGMCKRECGELAANLHRPEGKCIYGRRDSGTFHQSFFRTKALFKNPNCYLFIYSVHVTISPLLNDPHLLDILSGILQGILTV